MGNLPAAMNGGGAGNLGGLFAGDLRDLRRDGLSLARDAGPRHGPFAKFAERRAKARKAEPMPLAALVARRSSGEGKFSEEQIYKSLPKSTIKEQDKLTDLKLLSSIIFLRSLMAPGYRPKRADAERTVALSMQLSGTTDAVPKGEIQKVITEFLRLGGFEVALDVLVHFRGLLSDIDAELQEAQNSGGNQSAAVTRIKRERGWLLDISCNLLMMVKETSYQASKMKSSCRVTTRSDVAVSTAIIPWLACSQTAHFASYTIEELLARSKKLPSVASFAEYGVDLPKLLLSLGPRELAEAAHMLALMSFDAEAQDPLSPPDANKLMFRSRETATHELESAELEIAMKEAREELEKVKARQASDNGDGVAKEADEADDSKLQQHQDLLSSKAAILGPRVTSVGVTPAVDITHAAIMCAAEGAILRRLILLLAAPDPPARVQRRNALLSALQHGNPDDAMEMLRTILTAGGTGDGNGNNNNTATANRDIADALQALQDQMQERMADVNDFLAGGDEGEDDYEDDEHDDDEAMFRRGRDALGLDGGRYGDDDEEEGKVGDNGDDDDNSSGFSGESEMMRWLREQPDLGLGPISSRADGNARRNTSAAASASAPPVEGMGRLALSSSNDEEDDEDETTRERNRDRAELQAALASLSKSIDLVFGEDIPLDAPTNDDDEGATDASSILRPAMAPLPLLPQSTKKAGAAGKAGNGDASDSGSDDSGSDRSRASPSSSSAQEEKSKQQQKKQRIKIHLRNGTIPAATRFCTARAGARSEGFQLLLGETPAGASLMPPRDITPLPEPQPEPLPPNGPVSASSASSSSDSTAKKTRGAASSSASAAAASRARPHSSASSPKERPKMLATGESWGLARYILKRRQRLLLSASAATAASHDPSASAATVGCVSPGFQRALEGVQAFVSLEERFKLGRQRPIFFQEEGKDGGEDIVGGGSASIAAVLAELGLTRPISTDVLASSKEEAAKADSSNIISFKSSSKKKDDFPPYSLLHMDSVLPQAAGKDWERLMNATSKVLMLPPFATTATATQAALASITGSSSAAGGLFNALMGGGGSGDVTGSRARSAPPPPPRGATSAGGDATALYSSEKGQMGMCATAGCPEALTFSHHDVPRLAYDVHTLKGASAKVTVKLHQPSTVATTNANSAHAASNLLVEKAELLVEAANGKLGRIGGAAGRQDEEDNSAFVDATEGEDEAIPTEEGKGKAQQETSKKKLVSDYDDRDEFDKNEDKDSDDETTTTTSDDSDDGIWGRSTGVKVDASSSKGPPPRERTVQSVSFRGPAGTASAAPLPPATAPPRDTSTSLDEIDSATGTVLGHVQAHRTEVSFLLAALTSGVKRRSLQDLFVACGILPVLAQLCNSANWLFDVDANPPPRIHGPTCECRPETAGTIQMLRLLYCVLDRDSDSPAQRWISRRRFLTQQEQEKIFGHYATVPEVDLSQAVDKAPWLKKYLTFTPSCSEAASLTAASVNVVLSNNGKNGSVVDESSVLLEGIRMSSTRPNGWIMPPPLSPVVVQSSSSTSTSASIRGAAANVWFRTLPPRSLAALDQHLALNTTAAVEASISLQVNDPVLCGKNAAGLKPFDINAVDDTDDDDNGCNEAAVGYGDDPKFEELTVKLLGTSTTPTTGALSSKQATNVPYLQRPNPLLTIDSVCKKWNAKQGGADDAIKALAVAMSNDDVGPWAQELMMITSSNSRDEDPGGAGAGRGVLSLLLQALILCAPRSPFKGWLCSVSESWLRHSPEPARRWLVAHGLCRFIVRSLLDEYAFVSIKQNHAIPDDPEDSDTKAAAMKQKREEERQRAAAARDARRLARQAAAAPPAPPAPMAGTRPPAAPAAPPTDFLVLPPEPARNAEAQGQNRNLDQQGDAAGQGQEHEEEDEEDHEMACAGDEEELVSKLSLQSMFDTLAECLRRNPTALDQVLAFDAEWTAAVIPALAARRRKMLGLDDDEEHEKKEQQSSAAEQAAWSLSQPTPSPSSSVSSLLLLPTRGTTLFRVACDRLSDSNVYLRGLYRCEDWAYGATASAYAVSGCFRPVEVRPGSSSSGAGSGGRGLLEAYHHALSDHPWSWESLAKQTYYKLLLQQSEGSDEKNKELPFWYDCVDAASLAHPTLAQLTLFKIPLIWALMGCITIKTLTQETLCVLNTCLLPFIAAHRHGCLPAFIEKIKEHAAWVDATAGDGVVEEALNGGEDAAAEWTTLPRRLPSLKDKPVGLMRDGEGGPSSSPTHTSSAATTTAATSATNTSTTSNSAHLLPGQAVLASFKELLLWHTAYYSLRERDRRLCRSSLGYTWEEVRTVTRALLGLDVTVPATGPLATLATYYAEETGNRQHLLAQNPLFPSAAQPVSASKERRLYAHLEGEEQLSARLLKAWQKCIWEQEGEVEQGKRGEMTRRYWELCRLV
jgi:Protein of unknown function (DUF3689)